MTANRVIDLFGAIVTVALVATVLSPRSQTAKVITAFGDVFTESLATARG